MHARKIQRLQELWIISLTIRIEDESDYILNVTYGNGAYGYLILEKGMFMVNTCIIILFQGNG
jgi:hypothetical protein